MRTVHRAPDDPVRDSRAVDEYIARAPDPARRGLETLRTAIRAAAPDAREVISYRMPGYSYPGYPFKGMFVWFGLQRHHVGLYLRPPTIENHRDELAGFVTTVSAVHLPLDREIPVGLVQRLVRASAGVMRGGRGPAQAARTAPSRRTAGRGRQTPELPLPAASGSTAT